MSPSYYSKGAELSNEAFTRNVSLILLLFSVYLIADASTSCCSQENYSGFAMIFAAVVAFISFFLLLRTQLCPIQTTTIGFPRIDMFLSLILMLFGLVAIIFFTVTSDGVFNSLRIGYFALWGVEVTLIYWFVTVQGCLDIGRLDENLSATTLCTISVASFILIIASSIVCSDENCLFSEIIGIVLGSLSFVTVIIIACFDGPEMKRTYFVLVLAFLWLAGVLLLTIDEPFAPAGIVAPNGFFATWIAYLAAMYLSHLFNYQDNGETFWLTALTTDLIFIAMNAVVLLVSAVKADFICSGESELDVSDINFDGSLNESQSEFYEFECDVFRFVSIGMASISLVVIMMTWLLFWFTEESERKFLACCSYILLFIWSLGAIVMTFPGNSPFSLVSSAFLAIWVNCFLSIRLMFDSDDHFTKPTFSEMEAEYILDTTASVAPGLQEKSKTHRVALYLIVLGLIVQLTSVLALCLTPDIIADETIGDTCSAQEFFVITVVVLTFFLIVVFLWIRSDENTLGFAIKAFICLLWLISAGIISIIGPFEPVMGTGFLGAWTTAAGSILLVVSD